MPRQILQWKRPKSRLTCRNIPEMARHLGMKLNTFRHLQRDGVIERNANGDWDSAEITPILEDREERILAVGAGSGKSDILDRYRMAKAKLAELDLTERRAEIEKKWTLTASVAEGLQRSNAILCARLATYARRAALAVGQPGIEKTLDDLLRQDLAQCRLEVAGIQIENPKV